MKIHKLKNKLFGFTLIELLVVIAIMSILTTVTISGYNYSLKRTAIENDKALVRQLNRVLDSHSVFNDEDEDISKAIIAEYGREIEIESLTFGYDIYYVIDMHEFELRLNKGNVDRCNNLHYYLSLNIENANASAVPTKLIDLFGYSEDSCKQLNLYLNPDGETDVNNSFVELAFSEIGNVTNLVCSDFETVTYKNSNFEDNYSINNDGIIFYTPGVYLLNYNNKGISEYKIVFINNTYFEKIGYSNNQPIKINDSREDVLNCSIAETSSNSLKVSIQNPLDYITLIDYFLQESKYTQINFSYNQYDSEHIYIDAMTIIAEINGLHQSINMKSEYGSDYEYQLSFENVTDEINCKIYLRYLAMNGIWYLIEIPTQITLSR